MKLPNCAIIPHFCYFEKIMSDILTTTHHTHFAEIDSTNTALITDISNSKVAHTSHQLYTASHQTAGRGQHGRSWVSGTDNVFLSLYVPIGQGQFNLRQLSGMLSLAVGLEIAHLEVIQTINQYRTQNHLPSVGVKWANDVGFYDEALNIFKKLAGILIEPVFKKLNKNTMVGIVIGVGLNVNNSPVIKDGLYQATCLKELNTNLNLSANELYAPMTNAILKAIETCNHLTHETTIENFITHFNQAHILQGKQVHIFIQNNMSDVFAQGQCIGIGSDGELLLQNHHKITPIYAGMAKITNQA